MSWSTHERIAPLTWNSPCEDYRHHGKAKLMTLTAYEFMRRFLLHTLPDGFHRIRHYGFLANSHRAGKLALCRKLLDAPDRGAIHPAGPDRPSTAQPRALPVLRRRHAEARYPAAPRASAAALLERHLVTRRKPAMPISHPRAPIAPAGIALLIHPQALPALCQNHRHCRQPHAPHAFTASGADRHHRPETVAPSTRRCRSALTARTQSP